MAHSGVKKSRRRNQDSNPNDAALPVGRRQVLRGSRRGFNLEQLLQLPFNILFELFGHMKPMDLLNLARTSKDFRALLMSRSSGPFWRSARSNLAGLPDCPTFLSEPAYANLVFTSHCHRCLKPNISCSPWPTFRARYCAACRPSMSSLLDPQWPDSDDCKNAKELFMHSSVNGFKLYHLPDIDNLIKTWNAVKGQMTWDSFFEDQKKSKDEILEWADQISEWNESCKQDNLVEQEVTRWQRQKDIIAKLKNLGYGEDIAFITPTGLKPLENIAQFRRTIPLNDRAWRQMESQFVQAMNQVRKDRLEFERRELLYSRFMMMRESLSRWQECFEDKYKCPSMFEISSMIPEIRAIITAPKYFEVTAASFDYLHSRISLLVTQWEIIAHYDLCLLVREKIDIEKTIDPTTLAVGIHFECGTCKKLCVYPTDVYEHSGYCEVKWWDQFDEYMSFLEDFWTPVSWNNQTFSAAVDISTKVIEACGQDPRTVTVEQMDELEVRLYQDHGNLKVFSVRVFSWRDAVSFAYEQLRNNKKVNFKILQNRYFSVVSDLGLASSPPLILWKCRRCMPVKEQISQDKEAQLIHVSSIHNVQNPSDKDLIQVLQTRQFYLISDTLPVDFLPPQLRSALEDGRAVRVANVNHRSLEVGLED
ncbi:hypothetical protein C8Q75DRAFT_776872 [Abortiporus biennis]|nr:hypothetical protein C8Q75DRAFT_776872 [Abortiporus biennis]